MKKNMPLEGLRWSRDSGSALYDTPQTAVLGRAGGREIVKRLTGYAENNINIGHTKQYLEETMANPLIYTLFLGNDFLTVKLNYNVEVDTD